MAAVAYIYIKYVRFLTAAHTKSVPDIDRVLFYVMTARQHPIFFYYTK